MIEILAQVDWEQVGAAAMVVIVALGGQRGLEAMIIAWRGKRGPGGPNGAGNGKYVSAQMCELRTTEQEKLQNARYLAIAQALREVQDNVKGIRERLDELGDRRD